jgi:hypothetical protein
MSEIIFDMMWAFNIIIGLFYLSTKRKGFWRWFELGVVIWGGLHFFIRIINNFK